MMRLFLPLAAALVLSGCARDHVTVRVDASRPVAPANVTTPCDPLPRLAKPAPMGDLLEHADLLIGMYVECAERDAAKAEYIKSMEKGSNVD